MENQKTAGEDLTGKEYHLLKIGAGGKVFLTTSATDIPLYVLEIAGNQNETVVAAPMQSFQRRYVKAKGSGSAGDILIPATGADAGKASKLPATAGTYRGFGIAHCDFEDGDPIPFIAHSIGLITVT